MLFCWAGPGLRAGRSSPHSPRLDHPATRLAIRADDGFALRHAHLAVAKSPHLALQRTTECYLHPPKTIPVDRDLLLLVGYLPSDGTGLPPHWAAMRSSDGTT